MTERSRPTSTEREVAAQITGALRDLLAERYPYIGEHVSAVASLAARLAPLFSLSGAERSALIQAAHLHDIGKLAIPERILSKPGPLDEVETELMRRHTITGAQILSSSGAPPLTISFVRSSHEWIDGTAIPRPGRRQNPTRRADHRRL